jgi:glutaredoxin
MFTVYSKPACNFCEQAKTLLETRSVPYEVINVDIGQPKIPGQTYISRDELVSQFPDQRTLPLVLVDNKKIGGFKELKQYMAADNRAAA